MTIEWKCAKQGCYVDVQLPDWSMLDGCFNPTRVSASDIDGVVYQNKSVLFLEKKFPKGFIDEPQLRMINTLVDQGNAFIIIWCERPDGFDITLMRVFGIPGYDPSVRVAATLDHFRTAVKKWWSLHYETGKV